MTLGSANQERMSGVALRAVSGLLIIASLSACATTGQRLPVTPAEAPARRAELAATVSEPDRRAWCEELAKAEAAGVKVRSVGAGFGDGVLVGLTPPIPIGIAFYGAGFAVLGGIGALVQASKNAGIRQATYDSAMKTCMELTMALAMEPALLAETLGPDHPDVASSLHKAAEWYGAKERYAQAQPLYELALAIREQALGPEHRDVGESVERLAALHLAQGRHAEADLLYRRALAIREKTSGPEHPDVAEILLRLGDIAVARGDHADAEPLYGRALAIQEQALGPEHLDVARTLDAYALVLRKLDRAAEAEGMAARARTIRANPWGLAASGPPAAGFQEVTTKAAEACVECGAQVVKEEPGANEITPGAAAEDEVAQWAKIASAETKMVKIVSREAQIFEAGPDGGLGMGAIGLAKRGDTLAYTGHKQRSPFIYLRGGYLQVKTREGRLGWIHEVDVVELGRD